MKDEGMRRRSLLPTGPVSSLSGGYRTDVQCVNTPVLSRRAPLSSGLLTLDLDTLRPTLVEYLIRTLWALLVVILSLAACGAGSAGQPVDPDAQPLLRGVGRALDGLLFRSRLGTFRGLVLLAQLFGAAHSQRGRSCRRSPSRAWRRAHWRTRSRESKARRNSPSSGDASPPISWRQGG